MGRPSPAALSSSHGTACRPSAARRGQRRRRTASPGVVDIGFVVEEQSARAAAAVAVRHRGTVWCLIRTVIPVYVTSSSHLAAAPGYVGHLSQRLYLHVEAKTTQQDLSDFH